MLSVFDHSSVRELRLNRPPANALSCELIVALREAIEVAAADGRRAVVLSGSPARFSGGLDVPLLLGYDHEKVATLWHEFYALLKSLAMSPLPIAAAITGHAPAGGTVLGLFCDYRFMAEGDFKIGLNEVQVGIPLPPVILGALRRLVGPRQAERLGVGGLLLSPAQALAAGLVDELAPPGEVIDRAIGWCQTLLDLPPGAMRSTRKLARADLAAWFERDLEPELQQVIAQWWAPETQKTLRALAERLGKKRVSTA
ncbi:MAG TPA: enoyl-CoA hydratase/isomerase family protein [Terriglobales bacterium]|nr:enoyl-CoA hydratase/isomerase family protein [Terriglobales bacterium]